MSNKINGTLYIGFTTDLIKRIWQHKNKLISSFTEKYNLNRLVYYEQHHDILAVARREKQLKQWLRKWKLNLIHQHNPDWEDLYEKIVY